VLADPVFDTDDPRLAPEVVARLRAEQARKAKTKANGIGQPKASSFFLPASPRTGPVSRSLSGHPLDCTEPFEMLVPARWAQHFAAALQRAGG
jgi:hypothetical protein